jgi:hypothetical protein
MAGVHQRSLETEAQQQILPNPLDSGYLTDGRALFHVERTLLDNPPGELLIELEDCGTLELIVCSVQSVAELGMRAVKPLTPACAR